MEGGEAGATVRIRMCLLAQTLPTAIATWVTGYIACSNAGPGPAILPLAPWTSPAPPAILRLTVGGGGGGGNARRQVGLDLELAPL